MSSFAPGALAPGAGRRRRRIVSSLALAFAIAGLLAALSQGLPSAKAAAGTNTLAPNEILTAGQGLVSPNGEYTLLMQGDGNLVLRNRCGVLWASNTFGYPGTRLQNQSDDGNIVLVAPGDRPIWDTGTFGNPGTTLVLHDNGNLVASAPDGRTLWSTPLTVRPVPQALAKIAPPPPLLPPFLELIMPYCGP
jgi:hypothetical protein